MWTHWAIHWVPLHWRHNHHDGVSNHQPHASLLNRLFRGRSKKISKLRVTGLCVGNSPGPVNSPHKGPVTREMFPFDDVIMYSWWLWLLVQWHHNGRAGMSNHRRLGCLLNRLFWHRSKKISKLIPHTQSASNAKYVSIWWRHYVFRIQGVMTTLWRYCTYWVATTIPQSTLWPARNGRQVADNILRLIFGK